MRGIILVIVLELGLAGASVGVTGCAAHQTVVAPIPGQVDTLDGQVYRGLRDIQAAIDTYKAKVKDGSFHPTAGMEAGMDQLNQAYNTTKAAWEIYHASDAPARVSSAPALRASYDGMQAKYKAALKVGAPIPPLTQGAK
jgi:uncharacterized phage infection (PIP) family protein YhgE